MESTMLRFMIFVFCFVPALMSEPMHLGIIAVKSMNESTKSTFCIVYNPLFHEIPKNADSAKFMNLVDLTGREYEYFCNLSSVPVPSLKGSVVAVARGNCTYSEKAALVQSLGGSAILIVSPHYLHEPAANSSADYNEINITVAIIVSEDFEKMKDIGRNLSVEFYAPFTPNFDANLLLIWVTALFAVIFGSLWSGTVRHQLWLHNLGLGSGTSSPKWRISEEEAKTDVQFSPKVIIYVVILMCAMLLGLFFLYDYLVYVIIVLFALASSCALHDCLWMLMIVVLPPFATCRIPPNRIYWLKTQPEIRKLVLLFLCLAVGIWWLIVRHQGYAWVLQDILGVAFCIQLAKKIRLPSLKICSILLILLFLYDIFFVFITPLFTKDGSSVMVDIATGKGSTSGERLPLVLLFPKISVDEFSACFSPFSLLGFGDILVPGFLVSFCYGFDLQVGSRGIYFAATVLAYGLGLALTFIALALMKQGQPALLYLVPCTLIATILLAVVRKEFSQMWTGIVKVKKDSTETSDVSLSRSERTSPTRRSATGETEEIYMDDSSAGEEDKMLGQKQSSWQ